MKLAEEEIKRTRTEYNSEGKRKMGNNKKKSKFKKFINIVLSMAIIGGAIGFFLLYGPFEKFRAWYITTAMTTMNHQYLATWFYNEETINYVLDHNKVIEVEGETDTSLINTGNVEQPVTYANEYERAVLERDKNHPEYKIIEIKEKNFEGYLAMVYDPSKIHTLVTAKLNVSGQYVKTMAENSKAVLAINGGGFEDENHNSSGGSPLGLTIKDGKVITSKSYVVALS